MRKQKTNSKNTGIQMNLFGVSVTTNSLSQEISPSQNSDRQEKVSTSSIKKVLPLLVSYSARNRAKTDSADYSIYSPQLMVEGSQKHPTLLAESMAMNSVSLPKVNYQPHIPINTISEGILSNAQLESIILAGAAHRQKLHDDKTRGFFLGDGTGVGKGRTIAGIILDNFNQGRDKAIWISNNDKAHMDSPEYWTVVGGNSKLIIHQNKTKPTQQLHAKSGVLLTTYGTLRSGFVPKCEDEESNKSKRFEQLFKWLGKDFDGVIVFDESHKMANALDTKGARGSKKATLTAQAGLELQDSFPNAKIVYASATGATEVHNLIYATRLGLWGPGTPFSDGRDFVNKIDRSGVAAMELVAKDLKSLGLYTAKSLSYAEVQYDTMIHNITSPQRSLYNRLAKAWQIILADIESALSMNKTHPRAKSAALSSFWSTHQRFFKQIIVTIQLPTLIDDIKNEISLGNTAVIQLTSTNEAQTKRALAEAKSNNRNKQLNYDQLDPSPKATILEMINNTFPTVLYEEFEDDNGNLSSRPVTDSEGNHIHNRQAIAKRDNLIASIDKHLHIPESPLDTLINTFGSENIAEVTGRTLRIVKTQTDDLGVNIKEERRTSNKVKSEISEFKDDKRNILIFSDAGGTGASFHADRSFKNKRKRIHYLLDIGWRADQAVQGFGRTHRSNQVVAPQFRLVSTDIKGQKRFLSSIARRLEQLGALTKGQRSTGGQGILDNSNNFESLYAKQALFVLYKDIFKNNQPISMDQLQSMMGLKITKSEEGQEILNPAVIFDTKKFLNRIMSLEIEIMDLVFEQFVKNMDIIIEQAKANGNFDEGLKHVKALSTTVIEEQKIHVDSLTGAETFITTFELEVKNDKLTFLEIEDELKNYPYPMGYFINNISKRIYACIGYGRVTEASGDTYNSIKRIGITKNGSFIKEAELLTNYTQVSDRQAAATWRNQREGIADTKVEYHSIVKGLIFPIWDKLPEYIAIKRYIDNNGVAHLGRYITHKEVDPLKELFNLERRSYKIKDVSTALDNNQVVHLMNGMSFIRTRAQGQDVVRVLGATKVQSSMIEDQEGIVRIKNAMMDTKDVFIPVSIARTLIEQIIKRFNAPVKDIVQAA